MTLNISTDKRLLTVVNFQMRERSSSGGNTAVKVLGWDLDINNHMRLDAVHDRYLKLNECLGNFITERRKSI